MSTVITDAELSLLKIAQIERIRYPEQLQQQAVRKTSRVISGAQQLGPPTLTAMATLYITNYLVIATNWRCHVL